MDGDLRELHEAAGSLARLTSDEASLPVDLREPAGVRWDRLEIPAGWEPVAKVAREVAHDLAPLVERITDGVATEIPAYRSRVARDDIRASVHRNLIALLVGLAEHRGPTPDEVDVRRELGVRRALQGVPVDALIQAYHVGYREVWLALVDAVSDDPDTSLLLLTGATTVWRWVHDVTDALARAHATTTRSLEAQAAGTRRRFVELLVAGDLDGAEVQRLARSLGFHADGSFFVVATRGGDELGAVALQHAADAIDGYHAVAARASSVIVVSQGNDVDRVVATCREVFRDAAIAAGAERRGLRGARASLEDAEHALAVTPDGRSATFDQTWLWATLGGQHQRLAPLLAPGIEAAASHPHLARAVSAFAETGFSVSAAARRLGLHANTVAYRLERWESLTGWNPRTFPGLVRSLAALNTTA